MLNCTQINEALQQLLSGDTYDSTDYIPISDLEAAPLITFCINRPLKHFVRINLWGYANVGQLLTGNRISTMSMIIISPKSY